MSFARHRYDLRFRPFALSHCSKVQVVVGFYYTALLNLGELTHFLQNVPLVKDYRFLGSIVGNEVPTSARNKGR
jgi:hypothetical protein